MDTSDSTRSTGAARYRTWVAADTATAAAHAACTGPTATEWSCGEPGSVTTHTASTGPSSRVVASSIRARTGVVPGVPMISGLVTRAPTQCDRSIIS